LTLEIEPNTLKKSCRFANAIATPFDGFDLVVESFNEAASNALVKVVENRLPTDV